MKQVFKFLLLILVGYSANAQFPAQQTLGNNRTMVLSRGGLKGDSGIVTAKYATLPPLTAAISGYEGAIIQVGDSLYLRSNGNWVNVTSSGGSSIVPTWEETLQEGATATTLPIIRRPFLGTSLRFENPANSQTLSLVIGTRSDLNTVNTMPIRSGRLATWSQRIECVNDSLFAYDEGVRYWTGELCDDSVGTDNIVAGNGLERVGDTIGLRSAPYGSGNYLFWDSAGGTFSVYQANELGNESVLEIDNTRGFELYHKRNGNAQLSITGSNNGRFEILSEYFGESINAIYILDSAQNPSGNFSSKGLYFSVDDSIFITKYNTSDTYIPYDKQSNDTTGKRVVLMDAITGSLTTISPGAIGSGGSPTWGSITGTLYDQTDLRDTLANRIITGSDASLRSLHITGTNGNGKLDLRHQASLPTAGGQTTSLYANGNGNLAWKNDNLSHTTLVTNHFTADRNIRFQNKSYTLADSADVLNRADSTLYTTPHDLNVKADSILSLDDDGIALTTLGMSAKFISANRKLYQLMSTVTLNNGFYQGVYFTVKTPTLVTGVRWLQANTGNYTAGTGYNGFGLYSYNTATDSLEIIRETASEPNIWQRASSTNSWQSAAFTSTTTLQPGVYFIGWSYNNSSQIAAPTIGAGQVLQTGAQNLPNGKRLQFNLMTSTPSLPSRIGWGSTTSTGGSPFILIY